MSALWRWLQQNNDHRNGGHSGGPGAISYALTWEPSTSCGQPSPPKAEIDKWAVDSVVSPGADYDYGKSEMNFWFCANNPNETTGLGSFYTELIKSTHKVTCVKGVIQSNPCTGEGVFNDQGAHAQMVAAMTAGCVAK